jgi:hypothetical protein
MHVRAASEQSPANARHLGANGCRPASVAIGSATARGHNGSIVLPNQAIRGWVDSTRRYTHVSTPAARSRQASSGSFRPISAASWSPEVLLPRGSLTPATAPGDLRDSRWPTCGPAFTCPRCSQRRRIARRRRGADSAARTYRATRQSHLPRQQSSVIAARPSVLLREYGKKWIALERQTRCGMPAGCRLPPSTRKAGPSVSRARLWVSVLALPRLKKPPTP